jgi:phosphoribosyl-dephospho-CoA transferase
MLYDPMPAVHTLLRVAELDALVWDGDGSPADWVLPSLQRAPWVVIRRSPSRNGMWPVGVRGGLRTQRSAAWLPDGALQDFLTPQMLGVRQDWRRHTHPPAVAVLEEVAGILAAHGHAGCWGPAGSVGFELASGLPSTTADSDLDLVLVADHRIVRTEAVALQTDLSRLPVRIDTLLETQQGAVALSEYAQAEHERSHGKMLLRTPRGPRLVRDPWTPEHVASAA